MKITPDLPESEKLRRIEQSKKDKELHKKYINYCKDNELIYAVRCNDIDEVNKLLDEGWDINYKGECHRTPLFYAVYYRNRQMFDLLLNRGAKMEFQCLICSAQNNKIFYDEIIKHLELTENQKISLFITFLLRNDLVSAKEILKNIKVSIRERKNVKTVLAVVSFRYIPRTYYSQEKNEKLLETLKFLINTGLDLSYNCGRNLLHDAIYAKSIEAVELLLKHGASTTYKYNGMTPIEYAIYLRNNEAIKVLEKFAPPRENWLYKKILDLKDIEQIEKIPNDKINTIKVQYGDTLLEYALKHCSLTTINALLNKGAKVEKNFKIDSYTLEKFDRKTIDKLVDSGFDLKTNTDINQSIDTAIFAADTERLEKVLKLFPYETYSDSLEKHFVKILDSIFIKQEEKKDFVNCLFSQGAQFNIYLFFKAILAFKLDIAQLMLDKGLDINSTFSGLKQYAHYNTLTMLVDSCVTASECKTFKKIEKIIDFLIDNGIDTNFKTSQGKTAYQIAQDSENKKLIAYLESKGITK